jgi:ferredoxin
MHMAKIIYDRKNCIGCSACAAVCPSLFEMSEDQIANLKNSKETAGIFEVETGDVECAKEAADLCGAKVINVIL